MILALDPGGTTGWAHYRSSGGFTWGQFEASEHHLDLYRAMNTDPPNIVVCERFEYRNANRPGLVLDSREYIGVAKLWCKEHGSLMVMQNASQAKGFVKDENLKRLNRYEPGKPHAMDAMRHLLYYMVNNNHPERDNLLERAWK